MRGFLDIQTARRTIIVVRKLSPQVGGEDKIRGASKRKVKIAGVGENNPAINFSARNNTKPRRLGYNYSLPRLSQILRTPPGLGLSECRHPLHSLCIIQDTTPSTPATTLLISPGEQGALWGVGRETLGSRRGGILVRSDATASVGLSSHTRAHNSSCLSTRSICPGLISPRGLGR